MLRTLITLVVLGAIAGVPAAHGHGKATERYIPVARSPDSGKHTVIGTLEAVDPQARTLRINGNGTAYRVAVTADTKIWLDRSRLKITNVSVELDELRPGPRAEVKCAGDQCSADIVAEWVKVEVTPD